MAKGRKPPASAPGDVLDDGATRGPDGKFNPGVHPGTGVQFGKGNPGGRVQVKFDFRRMCAQILTKERALEFVGRVVDMAEGKEVSGIVEDGMRRDALKLVWNDVIKRSVMPDEQGEDAVQKVMALGGTDRMKVLVAQLHMLAESTGAQEDIEAAMAGEKMIAEAIQKAPPAPPKDATGRPVFVDASTLALMEDAPPDPADG